MIFDPEPKLFIGLFLRFPSRLDFYTYVYIRAILYVIMTLQSGEKKGNFLP